MTMMQRWRFHIEMLSLNLTVSMVMLLFLLLLSFLNASFRIERTPRRRSTRKGQMALEAHSWPKRPAAPIREPKNGALADVNWPIFKKNFLQRPLENRSIDSNQLRRGSSKAAARLRQGSDEAPTTFATSWTFPIDSDLILTVVWWKPVEPEDVNH